MPPPKGHEIRVVTGVEAIRRRPSMYIGDGEAAEQLRYLVCAVVRSAVEHPAGPRPSSVVVTVHANNSVAIVDDGPGVPIDLVGQAIKRPRFDLMMQTLLVGQMDRESWGQLCGIGVVLNAVSERLTVHTVRDGISCRASFSRGMYVSL